MTIASQKNYNTNKKQDTLLHSDYFDSEYTQPIDYDPNLSLHEEKEKGCNLYTSRKYAIASASFVSGVVFFALKHFNIYEVNKNPASSTLLTFIGSACIQNAIQFALPIRWACKERSFIADYATPAFLIATQVFLNIKQTEGVIEGFYTSFTVLYGAAISSFIYSLISQKWMDPNKKVASSALLEQKQLKTLPPLHSSSRIFWCAIKMITGAGVIISSYQSKDFFIARDLGIILLGDGFFQFLHEMIFRKFHHHYTNLVIEHGLARPKTAQKVYFATSKFFIFVGYVLPGILLAAAGTTEAKKINSWLGPVLFAGVGLFDGLRRHFEQIRYTETLASSLYELHWKPPALNNLEKWFRLFKWFVGTVGLSTFIGVSIAGLSPDNSWKFVSVPAVNRIALATFLVSTYAGYTLAEIAQRKFTLEKETTRLTNTAYFYTHYSPGFPLLGLYIIMKMNISDIGLDQADLFQKILGCIAYASLGYGVGVEANSRHQFMAPRNMSSLSAALIGKFLFDQIFKGLK